jgi:hypothetical protein
MGIFDKATNSLLSNFASIKEPVFLKEFTSESNQLKDLIELSEKLKDGDKKDIVERDILYLRAGISGEKNVNYEIKNSFIPLICLHDIRLEFKDYVAQFDFIVITNKFICVMETKKLFGNISINKDGDFIRVISNKKGKIFKEGMYSPISQNERHVRVLKEFLISYNMIKEMPIKSLVVMANDKTIIDKKGCPAHISKAIYKYDQITTYLKNNINDKTNKMDVSSKNIEKIAKFILEHDKPIIFDYAGKYGLSQEDYLGETARVSPVVEMIVGEEILDNHEEIRNKLTEFRLNKSREEKVKAYFIYNNNQMEDLISRHPNTIEELMNISGFGKVKVDKYGEDILKILNSKDTE